MTDDEKETELRTVYTELDEDRRQKMEFLAVNLYNAQKSAQSDKPPAPDTPQKRKNRRK